MFAGMLVYAPRFSKYLHGCASLNPNCVESMPYWFVKNEDDTLSTATWEAMADGTDDLLPDRVCVNTRLGPNITTRTGDL